MTPPRLEGIGLTKRFGGFTAVDNVDFRVLPGEIVGLIGPNGAGKTTLFNVISGVYRADAGKYMVNGAKATGLGPHRLSRLGLVRTFQLARELDRLTVLENVLLAASDNIGETLVGALFRIGASKSRERELTQRAREVLALVALSEHEAKLAVNLSGGQKKLLELARCLMAGADTILLDEMAAGVAPHLVDEIATLILRLNREHAKTFVVIEHNIGFIRDLCSRVMVMSSGSILAEGTFAEVSKDQAVVESYLGQAA